MGILELYMTDFCPFAQRAWITLLEKESDPHHPKLFNYREINFFNKELPDTKEFLQVHNTVPAGKYEGEELKESLPMMYWVDSKWPKINPLQPASEEGRAKMKQLIEKYTSGAFDIILPFYKLLQETSDDEKVKQEYRDKLFAAYAELSKDVQASGGPYLMGSQFTLVDIALIPFVDRAFVLLPHYKGVEMPTSNGHTAFLAWKQACEARPSVQISGADRLPRSMATQPFGAQKRADYIREVYAGYANGCMDTFRKQLVNAPPGQSTANVQKAIEEKKRMNNKGAAFKKHNKVVMAVAAGAIVAMAIAKAVQWNKSRRA